MPFLNEILNYSVEPEWCIFGGVSGPTPSRSSLNVSSRALDVAMSVLWAPAVPVTLGTKLGNAADALHWPANATPFLPLPGLALHRLALPHLIHPHPILPCLDLPCLALLGPALLHHLVGNLA